MFTLVNTHVHTRSSTYVNIQRRDKKHLMTNWVFKNGLALGVVKQLIPPEWRVNFRSILDCLRQFSTG